jgi:hypothetical protein
MSRRKRTKADKHEEIIDAMNRGNSYKIRFRERDKHKAVNVNGIAVDDSSNDRSLPSGGLYQVAHR